MLNTNLAKSFAPLEKAYFIRKKLSNRVKGHSSLTGFTLVEVMVAAAISSLMVAAVFGILIVGNKSWQLGSGLVSIQDNARKAVYYLSRDIRETTTGITNTTLDNNGDSITLNTPSGQTAYSLNASGTTNHLERDDTIIANNIANVRLTQTGRIITVTVVSQTAVSNQGEKNFTLTREVRSRNE